MKLFLVLLTLLSAFSAWAGEVTVQAGDTASAIAQKHGVTLEDLRQANAEKFAKRKRGIDDIRAGEKLKLPSAGSVAQSEAQCIALGVAPWNRYNDPELHLKGIDELESLKPEWKAKAKTLFQEGKSSTRLLGKDEKVTEMIYRGSKGVGRVKDKPVCAGEGGMPQAVDEVSFEVTLEDGTRVLIRVGAARFCGNPYVIVEVLPPRKPQPKPQPKPKPKPEPKQKIPPKIPPQVRHACYEWNLRAGGGAEIGWGGGDRSRAVFIDGELGFPCPFGWRSADGTWNEIVLAARYHGTDDKFGAWRGDNDTMFVGIGLRQAHPDGSGTLWRAMIGLRGSEGTAGLYAHDVSWTIVGTFMTHYRVDPNGDNETHYRLGLYLPLGGPRGSATVNGAPVDKPKFSLGFEAGIRYFLDNQREDFRKFVEANFTLISPDFTGFGFRLGLCNEFEVVCGVVGVNVGLEPSGIGPMVGIQVSTPGVIRVQRDGVIMDRVAKSLGEQGVEIEFESAPEGPAGVEIELDSSEVPSSEAETFAFLEPAGVIGSPLPE